MKVFFDGKFIDKKKSVIDIDSYCFLRGDGVFETVSVYNGKPFMMDAHLKRLFDSSRTIMIKPSYSRTKIKFYALGLIKENKLNTGLLRIFLTRCGSIHAKKLDIRTIMITYPMTKPLRNAKAITYEIERPLPKAKTLCFLPSILALKEARKVGASEALLVNKQGYVTEASSSNIFIVKKNILITPSKDILKGVMRSVVLGIAKNRMKISLNAIKRSDIYNADEVFITNVVNGIVPITQVDSRKIGNNREGKYTKIIRAEFKKMIAKY